MWGLQGALCVVAVLIRVLEGVLRADWRQSVVVGLSWTYEGVGRIPGDQRELRPLMMAVACRALRAEGGIVMK